MILGHIVMLLGTCCNAIVDWFSSIVDNSYFKFNKITI